MTVLRDLTFLLINFAPVATFVVVACLILGALQS